MFTGYVGYQTLNIVLPIAVSDKEYYFDILNIYVFELHSLIIEREIDIRKILQHPDLNIT